MPKVSEVKSFKASEINMLENVAQAVRKKGFTVMESFWTKTIVRGYDGSSGHVSYRTTMYKRETNDTFLLDVTLRDGEICLVTFFGISELLLPQELGL